MRLQQRDTMSEPDRLSRREFVALTAGLAAAGLLNATGNGATGNGAEATQNETGETAWASFRNGNQLRGIATSPLPEKLELLWKVPVDDGVTATAAIVGDHVFAATYGGELICLERKTGKRVWTYFSEEKKKPTSFIPGFQASPTVTSELVLIGD